MSWRAFFRTELLSATRTDELQDTETQRSELLERTFSAATKVLRFARSELCRAGVEATHSSNALEHTLTLDRRFLQVALIMNSGALALRRETGVIDLLHVERGVVVDGRRLPTGVIEVWFARYVLDLVRPR